MKEATIDLRGIDTQGLLEAQYKATLNELWYKTHNHFRVTNCDNGVKVDRDSQVITILFDGQEPAVGYGYKLMQSFRCTNTLFRRLKYEFRLRPYGLDNGRFDSYDEFMGLYPRTKKCDLTLKKMARRYGKELCKNGTSEFYNKLNHERHLLLLKIKDISETCWVFEFGTTEEYCNLMDAHMFEGPTPNKPFAQHKFRLPKSKQGYSAVPENLEFYEEVLNA